MKKIHKKIGAVALAGMVIAGGVAASGGSSHAVSFLNKKPEISVVNVGLEGLSKYALDSYNFIEEYVSDAGWKIIALSESRSVMNKHISKLRLPYKAKKRLLKLPRGYYSGEDVKSMLEQKAKEGLKRHRFELGNLQILVAR